MKRKPPKPWLVRRRQCLKCGGFFRSKGNWNRLCTVCRHENNVENAGAFDCPDLHVSANPWKMKSGKQTPFNTPARRCET